MNVQITTRSDGGRRRMMGTVLAVLFVLLLPAAGSAQSAEGTPAAPASAAPASAAPASAAPASIAPAGLAGGAVAFPTTLGGQPIAAETFSGPEWIARSGSDPAFAEGTEALVSGLGRTLDDLHVTMAAVEPTPGNHAVVVALQVPGEDARGYVTEAVQLLLGDVVEPELLLRPVAGKWVLRVVDAAMPGVYPRTVFLNGDTLWIIEGDEEYVWEALDQLPGVRLAAARDDVPLVTQVPLDLDDQRRTGLYEATEPLFLPTLSERLGPDLDAWIRDVYLQSGLLPADMLGVIAWWGVESSQESVQLEGYQLPGAPPELIERLRSEVILAEGGELPEGVVRSDGQIGGRDVATLEYPVGPDEEGAPETRGPAHIFSSGDTVWVVTDYAGEAAKVEELIAALP